MRWSQYFLPTSKDVPSGTEAVSHRLSLRAGLVNMLTSGVYSYLPLGWRVLEKIQKIIVEEMDAAGAHQLLLPSLQPLDLWKKTGRDESLKDVMISFKDKKGRGMCLGPTHEEVITHLVANYVQSYRQLPVNLYQIQTKFREELRARYGIVRASEFIMKDAYSFDKDWDALKISYGKMYEAYRNIFQRLSLDVIIVEADSGAMGGDVSHEYLVPADIGEDEVTLKDGSKTVAIELGHIFQLGTKYSESLGAVFLDEDGRQKPIIMGCYGIGVSRVLAAIIEKHHDEKGIIWPRSVAPFMVEVLSLSSGDKAVEVAEAADEVYRALNEAGVDVLFDDRDETGGRKFNDADLVGLPIRVIVGQRNLVNGQIELKRRDRVETELVNVAEAPSRILEMIQEA